MSDVQSYRLIAGMVLPHLLLQALGRIYNPAAETPVSSFIPQTYDLPRCDPLFWRLETDL